MTSFSPKIVPCAEKVFKGSVCDSNQIHFLLNCAPRGPLAVLCLRSNTLVFRHSPGSVNGGKKGQARAIHCSKEIITLHQVHRRCHLIGC